MKESLGWSSNLPVNSMRGFLNRTLRDLGIMQTGCAGSRLVGWRPENWYDGGTAPDIDTVIKFADWNRTMVSIRIFYIALLH